MRYIFLLLFLSSCASVSLPPEPRLVQELDVSRTQEIRDAISYVPERDSARLFALISFQEGEGKNIQRFRVAIVEDGRGGFSVQILPTTSLVVLERFHLTESGIVRDKSGKSPEAVVSRKNLFSLFGDIITPKSLFSLMLGRIPRGEQFDGFSIFPIYISSDEKIVGVKERLFSVYTSLLGAPMLQSVIVRDVFRELPILSVEYEGAIEDNGRSYPENIHFHLLRRDVHLRVKMLSRR